MLKKLTEEIGISGNEKKVRDIIKQEISSYCTSVTVDRLGNLIAYKKGTDATISKKLMLSAHMDEVGLMVTNITDSGFIKFKSVGGIDPRILLSKSVFVGEKKMPGIIGIKAIHLQKPAERKNAVKMADMYIDIGAKSKEEAQQKVSLGDAIGFNSRYTYFGNNFIKAKALDDRVGCAILIEMLKNTYLFDLYACFTVQEEVGLRGSKVCAYNIAPDMALVLEGTTCSDVPGVKEHLHATTMGEGPAISIMDRASYSDKTLSRLLYTLAKDNDIKVQYKRTTFGGNDAGEIHTSREGVPTAVISVPCRYIHSPVSVMQLEDYKNCEKLVQMFLVYVENNPKLWESWNNREEV